MRITIKLKDKLPRDLNPGECSYQPDGNALSFKDVTGELHTILLYGADFTLHEGIKPEVSQDVQPGMRYVGESDSTVEPSFTFEQVVQLLEASRG